MKRRGWIVALVLGAVIGVYVGIRFLRAPATGSPASEVASAVASTVAPLPVVDLDAGDDAARAFRGMRKPPPGSWKEGYVPRVTPTSTMSQPPPTP